MAGPVEPPPTPWAFPPPEQADENGIVGVGGDLAPGTLLAAYRSGIFPMPLGPSGPLSGKKLRRSDDVMAWWSPDPRAIIPLDGLKVSRSLRRSLRRYRVTVDAAFDDVVTACADPARPHGWITQSIRLAYGELHRLGWAHSVEAWSAEGVLVGGLYGVATGGLFAGESMFSHRSDASKVALVRLVELLRSNGGCLLDVQWATPHLVSLGAVEVPRRRYLELVRDAVRRSHLPWGKMGT